MGRPVIIPRWSLAISQGDVVKLVYIKSLRPSFLREFISKPTRGCSFIFLYVSHVGCNGFNCSRSDSSGQGKAINPNHSRQRNNNVKSKASINVKVDYAYGLSNEQCTVEHVRCNLCQLAAHNSIKARVIVRVTTAPGYMLHELSVNWSNLTLPS